MPSFLIEGGAGPDVALPEEVVAFGQQYQGASDLILDHQRQAHGRRGGSAGGPEQVARDRLLLGTADHEDLRHPARLVLHGPASHRVIRYDLRHAGGARSST